MCWRWLHNVLETKCTKSGVKRSFSLLFFLLQFMTSQRKLNTVGICSIYENEQKELKILQSRLLLSKFWPCHFFRVEVFWTLRTRRRQLKRNFFWCSRQSGKRSGLSERPDYSNSKSFTLSISMFSVRWAVLTFWIFSILKEIYCPLHWCISIIKEKTFHMGNWWHI